MRLVEGREGWGSLLALLCKAEPYSREEGRREGTQPISLVYECLGKNAIAYWQDTILLCFCIKKIPPSFGFKVRNSLLCACSDFKVCEVLLKLIPPSLPKQMVQWSLVLVPILLVLFPPSLCHQRKKRVMTRSDVSQSPISDLFYASPY